MAPEVYTHKNYDARAADVYSLGIILLTMLVCRNLYLFPRESEDSGIFHRIITGHLEAQVKEWEQMHLVPKDALDLLNRILRYEPERISLPEILKHPFLR